MSRQLEQKLEDKARRERDDVIKSVYGGLISSISNAGGELVGFGAKINEGDCLLTLRAVFPAGRMVSFVGGEDLASCLVKAMREGARDALRWKPDKYA